MQKIKVNKIKCKKCGDIIESTHTHDFRWCSCKSCAVDGGHEYLKRCTAEPNCYEDLSEFEEIEDKDIEEEDIDYSFPYQIFPISKELEDD